MIEYPTIDGSKKAPLGKYCYAFEKYDGSNLRFEWSPKRGWYKFGTRHRLFDHSDEQFKEALPLWLDSGLGKEVATIITKKHRNLERITAFCEFFGESSFAGWHEPQEAKKLMLFDVHLWKIGFLPPQDFLSLFSNQPWAAELIYMGNLNQKLIDDVKNNKFELKEGLVCKGKDWFCKIKTQQWLDKLKEQKPQIYATENEI